MAIRDYYLTQWIDECMDSLGDTTIFTRLDYNSGYWNIDVDEHDREKTTFCSYLGRHMFTRMSFGLRNALSIFQKAAVVILSNVKLKFALSQLEDVIV